MIVLKKKHDEIIRAYEAKIKMLEHRISVQTTALKDRMRDAKGRYKSHYEGGF